VRTLHSPRQILHLLNRRHHGVLPAWRLALRVHCLLCRDFERALSAAAGVARVDAA
jgi:hypothetical protein